MEQIYMIPVNEAFDATADKPECGCPLCKLYKKLQEDELDIILGASMMEPAIRMSTNLQGFCLTHYNMMLARRRMLGMGLMMESHLEEVKKMLRGPGVLGNKRASAMKALGELECSCYVCSRVDRNMQAMIATACYLWETDHEGFRKKFARQTWFCMPHYRAMLDFASKKMSKRHFPDFYDAAFEIQKRFLDGLAKDVSLFCKSFDYRYDKEIDGPVPKEAVKQSIRFLGGSFGEEEQPAKGTN
ncbi:MAG: hypothetical protein IJX38_06735 [Clostridia bacterium]|nr:hypothetical protein [Clostridia bacterium]